MYCLNMLAIALELAQDNPAYEDVASKFFEHFVYIAEAMNNLGGTGHRAVGSKRTDSTTTCCTCRTATASPLKVRSMVGLIPLFAVETLEPEIVDRLPGLQARACSGSSNNRPDLERAHRDANARTTGVRRLLSLVNRHRLKRVLRYMLDEKEFLSPYGIRALSRYHQDHPYTSAGQRHRISRGLRAGRIDHRAVRRQFQLARADLVPGQLSADRVAAEVSLLLRRQTSRSNARRAPAR